MRPFFVALVALFVSTGSLSGQEPPEHYLSVCAIFQNEAKWLKEWIEYHLLIGVEHFRLYNHQSEDDWESVLKPYMQQGVVTLVDWSDVDPRIVAAQPMAYADCVVELRGKSYWVAFIDIDEFLLPIESDSLRDVLEEFEEFGGVVVNWKTFGTSGVPYLEEEDLLIERLTWAIAPGHRHTYTVKSIVRPECALSRPCNGGAHRREYLDGYFAVDTDGMRSDVDEFAWISERALDDKLVLNHYKLRTMDWAYEEKAARQAEWSNTTFEIEQERMAIRDREFSKVEDLRIQRFVSRLRERMFPPLS